MITFKKRILTLLFFTIFYAASAQSTINITSHTVTIGGVVHDYSIGEMTMVTTEQMQNLIVTQGVLQPSSLLHKKINDDINSDFIDFVKVYPNPTNNLLFVELLDAENATIQLYDALGKTVINTKSTAQKSSLDLSSFATGTYYLVVSNPNQQSQKMSFNIQKIK